MDEEKVILDIGTWSSKCLACGKGADPAEECHDRRLGYRSKVGEKGCGKKFTHVTTDYLHAVDLVKSMRPDLEYIDPEKAWQYSRSNY